MLISLQYMSFVIRKIGSIALLLSNQPQLMLEKIWITLIALIVASFAIAKFYLLRKR